MKLFLSDQDKICKFSVIFKNLQYLVDAIKIYFSENGLYVQGMDNSSCCLFECNIPGKWFDEYTFQIGVDSSQISVNTAIMQKVIGTLGDKQEITMSYEGESDILLVELTKGTSNFDKTFEIALIDLDVELLQIPQQETDVDLVIQTSKFSELISQLLIFSENLTLQFKEDAIDFKASGVEGSMSSCIDLDDVTEYAIEEGASLSHSYSLKYLNLMCNFNKLSKDIVMGFNKDMPMSLLFNLEDSKTNDGDTENKTEGSEDIFSDEDDDEEDNTGSVSDKKDKCYVGFYLAPRMDDDAY